MVLSATGAQRKDEGLEEDGWNAVYKPTPSTDSTEIDALLGLNTGFVLCGINPTKSLDVGTVSSE